MYPEILKDFKSLHINYEMLNNKKAIIPPPLESIIIDIEMQLIDTRISWLYQMVKTLR